MILNQTIVTALSTYQLPAVFVGSFCFGETVIIAAAFLSAQGLWSIDSVFWLALAGTLLSDTLWFWFGQTILIRLQRWERYKQKTAQLLKALERPIGRRPFLVLLFIKFLYGTRILTIIYLSTRKLSLSTFILFDTIGTTIWLITMLGVGWLAGTSIMNLLPTLNTVQYAVLIVIGAILLVRFTSTWLMKKITKA